MAFSGTVPAFAAAPDTVPVLNAAPGKSICQFAAGATGVGRGALKKRIFSYATSHTFLFGLSSGHVIDGCRGGNGTPWLNHACAATCEAVEESGRVYIEATRLFQPGEECSSTTRERFRRKARQGRS
ncbi:SET domain-containing protein-lysine N-methyltransferase [Paraburkholderia sp. J10-1]|uniref:SET domain-containing protein-lysine N-methyltransferase n=1 Tax=Paraburkholderia sp. J10-1 TaxID=2805430 RepID=UPI0039EE750E